MQADIHWLNGMKIQFPQKHLFLTDLWVLFWLEHLYVTLQMLLSDKVSINAPI